MVVFDCNIYLDAARLLGAPFAWGKLHSAVNDLASVPVPHPQDEAFDSLRALRAAFAGKRGADPVAVWTSDHIDKMVRNIAGRPLSIGRPTESAGLGWGRRAAQGLVEGLIHGLVDQSRGGIVERNFPDGNPLLDHEDATVYGACRALAGEDPLAKVYCVTRDRGFREAYQKGMISGHSRVMAPADFVVLIRQASLRVAADVLFRRRR